MFHKLNYIFAVLLFSCSNTFEKETSQELSFQKSIQEKESYLIALSEDINGFYIPLVDATGHNFSIRLKKERKKLSFSLKIGDEDDDSDLGNNSGKELLMDIEEKELMPLKDFFLGVYHQIHF